MLRALLPLAAATSLSDLRPGTFHVLQPPAEAGPESLKLILRARSDRLACGCVYIGCSGSLKSQCCGQDGAICGLGSPYEFLVKTPEGGVNEKEIVLEFFGGGGMAQVSKGTVVQVPKTQNVGRQAV